MRLSEAIERTIRLVRATKSDRTLRVYSTGLHKLGRQMSARGIRTTENIVVDDFINFASTLAEVGYKPRTRIVYNAAARQLFEWLVLNGHLVVTHEESLRYKRAVSQYNGRPTRDPEVPDLGHVDAVVKHAAAMAGHSPITQDMRDAAMLSFLRSSGCRVGELVTLRVGHIDAGKREARVLGKGGKTRVILFDELTANLINRYWHSQFNGVVGVLKAGDWPAFMLTNGAPMSTTTARRIVARWVREAGIEPARPLTPHKFRHAFGTRMLAETGDLALVQDLMGHSSPETTRVYAKYIPDRMRKAYDKAWGSIEQRSSNRGQQS